jgi:pimeloyl-ACP methyl ester carboxylesterase
MAGVWNHQKPFLLAGASLLLLTAIAAAQTAAPPQAESPVELGPYLAPQRLVPVGEGRTINLICLGSGSPTVVLSAGLGSWSIVWRGVQPSLAQSTRVCAWDPAGFGFSGSSAEPQDAVHLTQDLEQTLKTANIDGPYLMVGHSAGAFVALRFADRHPRSVVGIVLVDPAIPEQDAVMKRLSPKFAQVAIRSRSEQAESLQHCAAQLKSGALKPGAPEFEECTAYHMPPAFSALGAALTRLNADPARLLTEASSLDNFVESQREVIDTQHWGPQSAPLLRAKGWKRHYGAMPLIVLTAGRPFMPPDASPEVREEGMLFYREGWERAHKAFAALSTRGKDELVPDSGHNIPVEKPEAVLAAINRVLAEDKQPQPGK